MESRKIPMFATDAEEAAWWYDHREDLADDLMKAMRDGRTGPGVAARLRSKLAEAESAEQSIAEKSSRAA